MLKPMDSAEKIKTNNPVQLIMYDKELPKDIVQGLLHNIPPETEVQSIGKLF